MFKAYNENLQKFFIQVNGFRCECAVGFNGTFCDVDIDECNSNPCQNEGTCEEWENTYKCFCKEGFEGQNCEVNINECASNPCLEGGKCIDLENDFKCQCQPGMLYCKLVY